MAFGMAAPSDEGFRAVGSDVPVGSPFSERRSDCTTTYTSRNSVETSAKYIGLDPADYRKRVSIQSGGVFTEVAPSRFW